MRKTQRGGPPNHHRRREQAGRWTTQNYHGEKKGRRKEQMGRWTTKTHHGEKDHVISVSSTNYPQTEKQRNIPILINYSDDNNSQCY